MIDMLIMLMILIFMGCTTSVIRDYYKRWKKNRIKKDIWDGSDVSPSYDMLSSQDREIQRKNKFKMRR